MVGIRSEWERVNVWHGSWARLRGGVPEGIVPALPPVDPGAVPSGALWNGDGYLVNEDGAFLVGAAGD